MALRIKELMDQQLKAEKEKGDLELKMLQAQINPHFLYNTLDSIRWIAVIQKNSGIVKMVTALSGLLKNMTKGFNEKVTLKKELEFLKCLKVHQAKSGENPKLQRYGSKKF
jgi:two-component system sensor histidine kinase YesM